MHPECFLGLLETVPAGMAISNRSIGLSVFRWVVAFGSFVWLRSLARHNRALRILGWREWPCGAADIGDDALQLDGAQLLLSDAGAAVAPL